MKHPAGKPDVHGAGVESNPSEWLVKQLAAQADAGAPTLICWQAQCLQCHDRRTDVAADSCRNPQGQRRAAAALVTSTRCPFRCTGSSVHCQNPFAGSYTNANQCCACCCSLPSKQLIALTTGPGGLGRVCAACSRFTCAASGSCCAHNLGALWRRRHRQRLQPGGESLKKAALDLWRPCCCNRCGW